VLRAAKIAEQSGVPGVAVIATGFLKQARATARAMGAADLGIVEYPGNVPMDTADQLADKVWESVLPGVVSVLSNDSAEKTPEAAEPTPRDVVFTGSLRAVQDYFDDREWSDGLPIVPPTREHVAEFLAWTDRDPDEVIGILPPEFREATVWSVAVNGVMAGCRPEYMPILLGIVEVISDPSVNLQDAGCTPGYEPLVVVSGEIVDALQFNTGVGNMKIGRRANASIGRFLRMYMRNVAGFRPGSTDKGSISYTFNVAMAENESAIKELGWEPVRVDLGFGREDNVVMVQSVITISSPVYNAGNDPVTMARPLVEYMAGAGGPHIYTAIMFAHNHPLVLMSPSVAQGFARHGWGKKEIRQYLFENTKYKARWLEHYPLHTFGNEVPLAELVKRGAADPLYAASDDPERMVPILLRPEWTNIVVAGDPERNQSRIYINYHRHIPPTARRIKLPADWRERLKFSGK
jgi:hypothetical protein